MTPTTPTGTARSTASRHRRTIDGLRRRQLRNLESSRPAADIIPAPHLSMPTASLTRLRKLPLLSNRTLSSLLRRLDGDHEIDAAARAALRVLHGRPDAERGPPSSAAITTVRSGPRSGRKPQPERHPRPGVAEPDVPATSSGHRGRAGRGPTRHPTEATTTTDAPTPGRPTCSSPHPTRVTSAAACRSPRRPPRPGPPAREDYLVSYLDEPLTPATAAAYGSLADIPDGKALGAVLALNGGREANG